MTSINNDYSIKISDLIKALPSNKLKVVFKRVDGSVEEITPVVIESCMNPGQKTIVPVTYKEEKDGKSFTISNSYKSVTVDNITEYISIYTEAYEPKIERHSCSECTNCGRC